MIVQRCKLSSNVGASQEDDPTFQQSMVEGGGAQRAVVDLLVEQARLLLYVSLF